VCDRNDESNDFGAKMKHENQQIAQASTPLSEGWGKVVLTLKIKPAQVNLAMNWPKKEVFKGLMNHEKERNGVSH
jgi:hypothetical protein